MINSNQILNQTVQDLQNVNPKDALAAEFRQDLHTYHSPLLETHARRRLVRLKPFNGRRAASYFAGVGNGIRSKLGITKHLRPLRVVVFKAAVPVKVPDPSAK
jgi:hypothetical protein